MIRLFIAFAEQDFVATPNQPSAPQARLFRSLGGSLRTFEPAALSRKLDFRNFDHGARHFGDLIHSGFLIVFGIFKNLSLSCSFLFTRYSPASAFQHESEQAILLLRK